MCVCKGRGERELERGGGGGVSNFFLVYKLENAQFGVFLLWCGEDKGQGGFENERGLIVFFLKVLMRLASLVPRDLTFLALSKD